VAARRTSTGSCRGPERAVRLRDPTLRHPHGPCGGRIHRAPSGHPLRMTWGLPVCPHPDPTECWTGRSRVRTFTAPTERDLRSLRRDAEGGTAPDGGGGRSSRTADVTDPWPRARDDRRRSFGATGTPGGRCREALHQDPEAAVIALRTVRPDAAGPCRRTAGREAGRASARGAHLRVVRRSRSLTALPRGGWRTPGPEDGRARKRPA
jgi:hypothetical protein